MSTVLIVEDDPVNRDAFSRILARAGFDVVTAENGLEGLEQLDRHRVAAIVSDFKMPQLSGGGFYQQLEELFPHLASRVVFVTAFADDPRLQEFFRDSGQPVLQKPVEMESLVAAVRAVAGGRDYL